MLYLARRWLISSPLLLSGLLLCCMLLPWSVLWAEPLVINGKEKQFNVTSAISVYRDDKGTLDWAGAQALSAHQWQTIESDVPSFGYDASPYWLRFTLDNQSGAAFDGILEIAYPILDYIDIYFIDDGNLVSLALGDTLAFSTRPIDHQNFAVPVLLKTGDVREFFIRVQTESSVQVPIQFWERDAFYRDRQSYLMGQGIYFGMLAVMILYNLFIFFSVRHPSYIYYAVSVIGIGLFMAALHGFGFQYLWPGSPQVNQWALIASLGLFGSFASSFTISFLQLRKYSRRLHILMLMHVVMYVAVFFCAFVMPYKIAILIAITVGFTVCVSALFAGAYTLYKGLREARYYVLAYSSLVVASIIISLNKVGVIPRNFFTENFMQISSMMEVTLLSFALADRINQERRQKYQAQQRALEQEKLARMERERYLEVQFSAEVEDLKAKQKVVEAEAESRAKSDFLATMSHEIRTPMNGVLGMAELLSDTPLNTQQQQYLKVINSSGKSLLNIINDILDYSKIVAGRMELEAIDIELEALCSDCANVFYVASQRKEVEFLVDIASDVPRWIQGDPTRLRQVLLNLLGNAFKFTRSGSVLLSVEFIAPENDTQPQLRFRVQDTGIGIAEQYQQDLFAAFIQADSTTTRQFGGTGLGLTICQRLVEIMGGSIGVISVLGQGSCFEFTVPYLEANHTNTVMPVDERSIPEGCNVILVDDSVGFLEIMHRQGRASGISIYVAHSEDELLTLARDRAVQRAESLVVAVSQKVGADSGLKLLEKLEQEQLLPSAKRILLTSIRPNISADSLASSQVDLVLQKPMMWCQFRESLVDLLLNSYEQQRGIVNATNLSCAGRRVLVAEDNSVNQLVISKMLAKMQVQCDIAENGQQALDMLLANYSLYDAVLMDCEMPVMDGYQASERLRQQEAKLLWEHKPIIALTAHVLAEHREKALRSGMDDVLCKPLEYATLERTLQAVFQSLPANQNVSSDHRFPPDQSRAAGK